ncbi:MAG TPA: cytochrome c biogenesis CcdA family protein [Elusimicrobiales bacterium]|nr:cytochrome c biogenesis CcdA family protein [Elusimicrobiales bacterium]HOL63092.1 cytochrome c biogenesis CcdA family protein [Elusimicrobiales bacterium]HPO95895.1 cytochrome c biogenesis CcdA family protein [Elusimicrobiales bacterium]
MKEYLIAFFSGTASFFSPCVLPLIPGYLSLISGFSAKEILSEEKDKINKLKFFYFSVFFVLGFSIVFTVLGAFSSMAGGFIIKNREIFQKVMGIVMVIIGLHISGVLTVKLFNFEKRKIYKSFDYGYLTSFLTGMSFAFGWSPCIGPFLANILLIASTKSVYEGSSLLMIYSLGLGFPFIIASVGAGAFFRFVSSRKKVFLYIEKISGFLIILIGILIFFNKFSME